MAKETVEAKTKAAGVKGPQDVPQKDVNTALRGAGGGTSSATPHTTRDGVDAGAPSTRGPITAEPAVPVETQAARDAAAKRALDGGTFDEAGWPVASPHPGDEEHERALIHHLSAITDVGTLARVREVVEARCAACRVKPVEKKS